MANQKRLLMFLLMFCIGLAPLQSTYAGNVDHMEDMPAGHFNCDLGGGDDPDLCEGAVLCSMSVGSCGAYNISMLAQKLPGLSMAPSCLDYYRARTSLYRSHLDFSIYRPPIT